MAVEHLASLGHRRMAMWMRPGDQWPAAATAFREEMKARGFPEGVVTLSAESAGWVASLQETQGPEPLTAVLVPYYEYACHALAALKAAALRVPEDMSVICLGGLAAINAHNVDFTATISPIEEIAERALGLLIGGDGKAKCHYRFKPTLRAGATSAPAARRS
jgi:DNA-binding LacI/PurR family transcriptional regulator